MYKKLRSSTLSAEKNGKVLDENSRLSGRNSTGSSQITIAVGASAPRRDIGQ
jgi:hypothetical protein